MNYPTLYENKPPEPYASKGVAGELEYFETFGLGVLMDCVSCVVREARNGAFELEMEYLAETELSYELKVGRIIMSDVTAEEYHIKRTAKRQPFRIYNITRTLKGNLRVNAEHVTFELNGFPVYRLAANPKIEGEEVIPRNVTSRDYLRDIINKAYSPNENSSLPRFTVSVTSPLSNKTLPLKFDLERRSITSCILDGEQSFLGLYGGEVTRDMYDVTIHEKISTQTDGEWYRIDYGGNMTGFDLTYNMEEVATHVVPYVTLNVPTNINAKQQVEVGKDAEGRPIMGDGFYYITRDKWQDQSLEIYPNNDAIPIQVRYENKWRNVSDLYGFHNVIFLDMSQHAEYLRTVWIGAGAESIQEEIPESFNKRRRRVLNAMDTLAKEWIKYNKPHVVDLTCKVDFLAVWETVEYQGQKLDRLNLGDFAVVNHPDIPFEVQTKCIATEFDVLKDRFVNVELASRFEGQDAIEILPID